jgi:hypothetical protein
MAKQAPKNAKTNRSEHRRNMDAPVVSLFYAWAHDFLPLRSNRCLRRSFNDTTAGEIARAQAFEPAAGDRLRFRDARAGQTRDDGPLRGATVPFQSSRPARENFRVYA